MIVVIVRDAQVPGGDIAGDKAIGRISVFVLHTERWVLCTMHTSGGDQGHSTLRHRFRERGPWRGPILTELFFHPSRGQRRKMAEGELQIGLLPLQPAFLLQCERSGGGFFIRRKTESRHCTFLRRSGFRPSRLSQISRSRLVHRRGFPPVVGRQRASRWVRLPRACLALRIATTGRRNR